MPGTQPTAHEPITPTGAALAGPALAIREPTGAEIATAVGDYRSGLSTPALVAEIRGLLATERRAERLICRYLADLADRIRARQDAELGVYDDEFHAARCFFGLGARDTRERVRVGRALRKLPQIERAFVDGELCYSRVREVTRVATVHSEPAWLELARRLNMRSLERRVAAQPEANRAESDPHGQRRVGEPARKEWMGADTVRVTFELSTEAWTLLERAMREARRTGAAGPSDGDALEAVALAALSVQRCGTGDAGDGIMPCQRSNSGESETEARAAAPGRSVAQTRGTGRTPPGGTANGLGMEATQHGSANELGAEATQHGSANGLGTEATQHGSANGLGTEATQHGSANGLGTEATQHGSSGEPTDQRIEGERDGIGVEQACEPALHLMQVMGRSAGWTLDALTDASGLSAREVCVAVTLLELGGHVRRHAFLFDPV